MATNLIDRTDLLSLSEAARRLPGRPHRCTLWRWHRHGIETPAGRVRLHIIRLGRKVLVAPEDIATFSRSLTTAAARTFEPRPMLPPVSRRMSRAEAAELEADAMGL